MNALADSVPVLSCADARTLEAELFGGDDAKEWAAMQQAGRAIAAAVLRDFAEIGGFPARSRILVLVGKGHNGGDALIAAGTILRRFPEARAEVVFVFGVRALRPLAMRAWRENADGIRMMATDETAKNEWAAGASGAGEPDAAVMRDRAYDLCLDGVFGFQFRPPAEPRVAEMLARVNGLPIRLRAAVDLPSAGLFRADFTYATGSVKTPVLDAADAGRVRYLDLGFFRGGEAGAERVLTRDVLAPLRALRPARSDKRSYGHVLVLGGSRNFPGAILMSVLAALRSGAGLVTAFVPESLAAAFAARAPEAMWVGWPETPTGGLALEGEHLWRAKLERADAAVIGPGMGREPETLALVSSVVASSPVPLVIDADALQPDIVRAGKAARILTPHAGELARIARGAELRDFAAEARAVVVAKGPVTRIAAREAVYHSFFGGPVLARGGSGDLLSGLIGGLLAQTPDDALLAAARGVVWHGLAADLLARAEGQTPVRVTQLLDFLSAALRESPDDP